VKPSDYPGAEAYYRDCLSIPLYPTLSSSDQDRVVDALRTAVEAVGARRARGGRSACGGPTPAPGGHQARCAALARALRALGARTLTVLPTGVAPTPGTGAVLRVRARRGSRGAPLDTLLDLRADRFVVDAYGASPRATARLRRRAPLWRPLDLPKRRAGADGVWSAMPLPRGAAADVPPRARLFGPRYAPVLPSPARRRGRSDAVVVSLGAEDPRGMTVPLARALSDAGRRVVAVVGPGVARRGAVLRDLARLPRVTAADGRRGLGRWLAGAEAAVLPPSQSALEGLRLGVAVVAVPTAASQRSAFRWLTTSGLALAPRGRGDAVRRVVSAIAFLRAHPALARGLRASALRAFDGRGAERVARAILGAR
jgi:spore coat polysaccharide biosynthesis predicted glycosyltransferase SpsG